jgi:hypothetical protein
LMAVRRGWFVVRALTRPTLRTRMDGIFGKDR